MEQTHWHLIIVIIIALSQNSINVEGRAHFHKEHKGPSVYALSFHDPVSQSPAYSPVQSDTSEPGNSSSDCIFDVTSFGAIGDGSADDTAAFRAAWKAACDIESGVLLAPSNYTFMITSTIFSGPCKPGLVFQVDGVLMPPNGPGWWPKSDSNREWLVFYRLDQMTFTGTGTIEGNGEQWWELPCKPHRGPNGSTLPGPCDSPTVSKSAQHSVLAFTQSIIEIFLSNNANGRQICIDWRGDNTEVILNGL